MSKHEKHQSKVTKSLNQMKAEISFLNECVKGLGEAFKEFEAEITEFMAFPAENYVDHEKRIKALEKKL